MTSINGTRISLSGSLGTVKYTGPVDGTTGIWLGVDWDDQSRGKHDGTKAGKRYFSCRFPTSGSFVRNTKAISFGVSFLEALNSKYVDAQRGSGTPETVTLGSSKGAIVVEAPGLDKIRGQFANLQGLREVSLGSQCVAVGNRPNQIHETCPGVRGLDLSASLISSWDIVASITAELPMLNRLSLNRNRLLPFTDVEKAASSFLCVTDLHLSGTAMSWTELEAIIAFMPALQTIEFGYNNLVSLAVDENRPRRFPQVEDINLGGNQISAWKEICLGLAQVYPSLKRLIITENLISNIEPFAEGTSLAFNQLKSLSFSSNSVQTWSDIDNLARWCPALEIFSISSNPVTEGASGKHSRPFTVARIPTLKTLDGTAISSKERTDCELFYLSHVFRNGPSSEEDRVKQHPRWLELCNKHGRPEGESSSDRNRVEKLSNHLIELKIRKCPDRPPPFPQETETLPIRVLLSMNLKTFRLKAFKMLKSPGQKIHHVTVEVWLKMGDGTGALLTKEQDDQDLEWLGLENESELWLHIG